MSARKERKIGICNDNTRERNNVKRYLEDMKDRSEHMAIRDYDSKDVWEEVKHGTFCCDILIMDVIYPKLPISGIELAQKINNVCPACKIIFLTEHIECCSQVYETDHCYFVLKADLNTTLRVAFAKALRLLEGTLEPRMIGFVSNSKRVYVSREEILYIERQGRKINVITQDKCYQTYQSILEFENELKDEMVRIHAGFIVNMKYVVAISRDYVEVTSGRLLPIGRTFENNIKSQYKRCSVAGHKRL